MRSLGIHNIVNLATRAEAAANRFVRTALIMIVTHVSNAAISFPAAARAEEEEEDMVSKPVWCARRTTAVSASHHLTKRADLDQLFNLFVLDA